MASVLITKINLKSCEKYYILVDHAIILMFLYCITMKSQYLELVQSKLSIYLDLKT